MQFEFVHESRYCTGCKACQVACKDYHGLPTGILYRRIVSEEGGGFQTASDGGYKNDVFVHYRSISCSHCADPVCMAHCPANAITKRMVKWGEKGEGEIVYLDSDLCIGCGLCKKVCPCGSPQQNPRTGRMEKCDFCMELLEKGKNPACVDACPLRLLHVRTPFLCQEYSNRP